MHPPASSSSYKVSKLARNRLVNVQHCSHDAVRCLGRVASNAVNAPRRCGYNVYDPVVCHMNKPANVRLWLVIITVVLYPGIRTKAQEPTPQTVGQPGVTIEEVIVTGSNIPTAEEVGPQPVILINRDLIFQFGVRSATDLILKLPMVTGPSLNENLNFIGDGRTEIDLRGLFSKETLVLQDGRRLATDGFVGYDVGRNFIFTPTVDLNLFPIRLIDHIDVLGTTRPPFTAVTRSLEFLTFG